MSTWSEFFAENKVLVALGAVGALGATAYIASRRKQRQFRVTARIAASKEEVFALHADPARFYRVLEFKKSGDKGYRVVAVHESADRTLLSYALEHSTPFGMVRSTPLRFDIERFGDAPGFKEMFSVIGTDVHFQWRFRDAADKSGETDVELDISLDGPAWAVRFLSRVKSDFEARFEVTRLHLKDLITPLPAHQR
jgi:hypothetical protein